MFKNIFILSGPTNSGKTSKLLEWCKNRKDVYGILTPKINGKRIFQNVNTGEQFEMEACENEEKILSVGKYVFSTKSFEQATFILKEASNKKNGWLIVDEVGPMELKGEGFSTQLKQVLLKKADTLKVIIVVRETLVEEVVNHFCIQNQWRIFSVPDDET